MDHVLIDKEVICDADLYSVRNELEARLAALLAGEPVDPVQLAKDQAILITNLVTVLGVTTCDEGRAIDALDHVTACAYLYDRVARKYAPHHIYYALPELRHANPIGPNPWALMKGDEPWEKMLEFK
ncbi:hypothetical protein D3C80_96830 [compost metagenome]